MLETAIFERIAAPISTWRRMYIILSLAMICLPFISLLYAHNTLYKNSIALLPLQSVWYMSLFLLLSKFFTIAVPEEITLVTMKWIFMVDGIVALIYWTAVAHASRSSPKFYAGVPEMAFLLYFCYFCLASVFWVVVDSDLYDTNIFRNQDLFRPKCQPSPAERIINHIKRILGSSK